MRHRGKENTYQKTQTSKKTPNQTKNQTNFKEGQTNIKRKKENYTDTDKVPEWQCKRLQGNPSSPNPLLLSPLLLIFVCKWKCNFYLCLYVSAENQSHYNQLLGKPALHSKTKRPLFGWKNQSVLLTWPIPFLLAAVREGIREHAGVVQLFHICYK